MRKKQNLDPMFVKRSERYNQRRQVNAEIDYEDFKFMIEVHMEFAFEFMGKTYEIVMYPDKISLYLMDILPQGTLIANYKTKEDLYNNFSIEGYNLFDVVKNMK